MSTTIRIRALLGTIIGLLLSLLALGCSDDPPSGEGAITVFIVSAEPAIGHAPLDVTLQVDFPRGDFTDEDFEVLWDFGDGATLKNQTAPVHTFETAGSYTASVTVKNLKNGQSGSDSRELEVLEAVELSVSGVEARPLQIQAGQELQVLYSLRNEGVAIETPFTSIVFLTTDVAPEAKDLDRFKILSREAHEGLPGGGGPGAVIDRDLPLLIPNTVASGTYYLGVLVDADQVFGEVDEDNNLMVSSPAIEVSNPRTDGPDLSVSNVTVTPKRTRVLTSVTVSFVVENLGLRPALLFDYAVYLSEDDFFAPQTDQLVLEASLSGVLSQAELRVDDVLVPIVPSISAAGDYHFFVVVDPQDQLVEMNEGNNLAKSANPVSVTDEPIIDADIVVLDFQVAPDSTYLGGSFQASVQLMNQGSQATGSFICSIYFSDDQVLDLDDDLTLSSLNVFDLGADSTQQLDGLVRIPPFYNAGDYWAFVFCDASGVVVEYDEDNNVQRYSAPVRVALTAEVDLVPGNLALSPTSPIDDGTELTLSFEICNTGSTGASPNLVRVLLSDDGLPDVRDVSVFEGVLPGVSPDDCPSFEVVFPGNCTPWTPNYEVLVQVDVRDVLAETSEANNVAVLSGGLRIDGPTCACEADFGEPNDFSTVPFPLLQGANPGFSLCSGDSDWFSIGLAAGESLVIALNQEPDVGDLNLLLFDPSGQLLDESAGASPREAVDTFLAPFAGDYLLQVVPGDAGAINTYELDVQVSAPVVGGADLAAVSVSLSTSAPALNTPFNVSFVVVNLGDQAVNTPFRVSIVLDQNGVLEPLTDTLLDQITINSAGAKQRLPQTRSLVIPGETPSGLWHISLLADSEGTVTELNETNNGSSSNPISVDTSCYDLLEPNDSLATAVMVVPQPVDPAVVPNTQGLVVCKSNPDFYRVAATSGSQLRFQVAADAAAGDIDIVLRNATGFELSASRTTADVEEVFLPVVIGDQDLYLEVIEHPSQFNADSSVYDLTITMTPADPGLLCNSVFEPNDSFAQATSLLDAVNTAQTLAICPQNDSDVFQVTLTAGTAISVSLVTSSTHMRASLYDSDHNFMQTIFDPASESLAFTAPSTGPYFIKVFTGAGASREETYTLAVTGLNGVDLLATDFLLAPSTLNAGDPVQYAADITNAGTQTSPSFAAQLVLSADTLIDGSDTVLTTVAGLGPLASQGVVSLNGKVDIPVGTPGGRYTLALLVDSGDAALELNEFNNLAFGTLDVAFVCLADVHEGPTDNNQASRATDLAAAAPAAGSICPGDQDWFVLTVSAGQQVTLDLSFTHASGDLDLYVYDSALVRIGQGQSLTDNEQVVVTPAATGALTLQVKGFTQATTNSYTLDFNLP